MENNNIISSEVDKYLSGKMNNAEKIGFEDKIANNPELKKELDFQSELIEAIKTARKAELKARLNKIPTQHLTRPSYKNILKIASGIAIVGGIVAYLVSLDNNPSENKTSSLDKKIVPIAKKESVVNKELESNSGLEVINEHKIVKTSSSNIKKVNKNQKSIAKKTDIELPDFTDLAHESISNSNDDVPSDKFLKDAPLHKSDVEVAIVKDTEYKFHYKNHNGKLYLLCDFKGKPYDIIALNNNNLKQLYLFFDNQYFEIKNNKIQATPLKTFKSPEIIKQLDKVRNHQ
ncbi:MAG: hypothetical protein EAZ07_09245 [Cytophagales bacterium]|nr:MAG: hypothetical protein EAZ07_09245 [Cytophagales bacterium]